jgi:nucleoside-triphosphatase THEP1
MAYRNRMMRSDLHRNIFVLTGQVHSGKTTQATRIVQRLRGEGLSISGFLCPGSFREGIRNSFTLVNLGDGKGTVLAEVEKREGWIRHGRYYFNPQGLSLGQRIIRSGLDQNKELLVVDEIGPIELEGGGWSSILKWLGGEFRIAQLWIVREQVLKVVMERWSIPPEQVVRVLPEEEDRTIKMILSYVQNNEIGQAIRSRRGTGD